MNPPLTPPTVTIRGIELTASDSFTDAHFTALIEFCSAGGDLAQRERNAVYAFRRIFPAAPDEWLKDGFWLNSYDLLETVAMLAEYVEAKPALKTAAEFVEKNPDKIRVTKSGRGFAPATKQPAKEEAPTERQTQIEIEILERQLAALKGS